MAADAAAPGEDTGSRFGITPFLWHRAPSGLPFPIAATYNLPRMDIVGIGIDIVELRRIRSAYDRYGGRFVERILTERERERAAQLRDPVAYLAGRFAAKECILKVLGTGLSQGISWRDLHVVRQASGAPSVFLSGKALRWARRIGLGRILVSVSHGRDYAVAQAVGLAGDPDLLSIRED